MKPEWHFRERILGETNVESISDEFFASDVISDPGRALVREGIQNSLDAARDGQKVRVRILLSTGNRIATRYLNEMFMPAWPHFIHSRSGLRKTEIPDPSEPCDFLVFEDFNTRGLKGDIEEGYEPDVGSNHFYYFFRAEGQSDKRKTERGSWGVGKQTFARASRIRSILGLTIQDDTRETYLMGRSLLKIHRIDNKYHQDGYYGIRQDETNPLNQLVLPTNDMHFINGFASSLRLKRDGEPGLSVVIPWIDREITGRKLMQCVLKDFFYSILSSQIEVSIDIPDGNYLLNKDSLFTHLDELGNDAYDIHQLSKLTLWTLDLDRTDQHVIGMPDPRRAWSWSESLFDPAVLEALTVSFKEGEKLALRVPVMVRKRDESPQPSHFDIYLQRDDKENLGYPVFIRDGLIISDVKGKKSPGTRALVVLTDPEVVSFVRDAENPSHTEWRSDSSNFKGQYVSGSSDLEFIKNSVAGIVNILTQKDLEADPRLLVDFFSIPETEKSTPEPTKSEGEDDGKTTQQPPKPPKPKLSEFRIQKTTGGFSISKGRKSFKPPLILQVWFAYDIRRGNPLKRYSLNDFRVGDPPLSVEEINGIKILKSDSNHYELKIENLDFCFKMKGFDQKRDIYVKVIPRIQANGSSSS